MNGIARVMPFRRWLEACTIYADRRVIAILFLGFSSGLPLALTFGTLSLWLAEVGVSKTTIGLFALMGAPYTFKFLWAPLVDRMPVPYLTRRLGRRRGWAIVTQLALMATIAGLGATNPVAHPGLTALFALGVAFWSASQDIVIDAYRVEILEERQYGAGAAMIVLGYRIGMLVSGAGALYLATYVSWFATYGLMAAFMTIGIATVLLNPEPTVHQSRESIEQERRIAGYLDARPHLQGKKARALAWIYGAVISPFAEFMGRRGWLMILLFILLYKFGDALAGVMSNPFYVELGFTKIQIASISKAFGLGATIIGGMIGGVIVNRMGILKSLFVCGILQMLSNLMFAVLAMVGNDPAMLSLTIAVENLSGGMGTAAFVAYLSSLCNIAYTATQYALLTSFMAFGRTVLSSSGGWLADHMSWISFFVVTTGAALPGLLLLVWITRRLPGFSPTKKP
ncbi:MAG: AmpG family muropeptide MFS transporter [Deltaproteobacteria bacterium]|nr:AmpG family muropeptide MFS transporter [Deltaproteobacteria bacterium]MBW2018577.1 AmpG family muropeptide MFS transporter [Deltaproteobacteria bacterium]MBW2074934.1 AmpG family muropeptide MFS transporter [Deltaproteobacteria bacterium]